MRKIGTALRFDSACARWLIVFNDMLMWSLGLRITEGQLIIRSLLPVAPGGGALGYFLDGYVRPGLQIGTPFWKKFPLGWYPVLEMGLEFALKLIPRFRNGPIFYTPLLRVCKLK